MVLVLKLALKLALKLMLVCGGSPSLAAGASP
jgi:hypothetical protein